TPASAGGDRDTAAVPIRAITLDIDDTLWPFGPVAVRIQGALTAWLAEHCPGTAAQLDPASAQAAAAAVQAERPDLAHDVTQLRREVLRRMIGAAGEDPALADAALAVVVEARQQV